MKIFGAIFLGLILALPGNAQTEVQQHWTKENIAGLNISLNDPERIEQFLFSATGVIDACTGKKSRLLEPWVTSAIFHWKLINSKLQITNDAGAIIETLTFVSMDFSKLTVRRSSGQLAEYKIQNKSPMEKRLGAIIIPKINFDSLDIEKVLDYLTTASKEFDPEHKGIKFSLRLSEGDSKIVSRPVSITLDQAPLDELLRYITAQTNLAPSVQGDTVVLKPSLP